MLSISYYNSSFDPASSASISQNHCSYTWVRTDCTGMSLFTQLVMYLVKLPLSLSMVVEGDRLEEPQPLWIKVC